MKNVAIAGATGLVGAALVRELEGREDVRVHALVRRAGASPHAVVLDVSDPNQRARLGAEVPCDVLVCSIGTTIRKAGSQAAFRAVDHDIAIGLLERCAALSPRPAFALVSSVGADHPTGFYLQTKHEIEWKVKSSGVPYAIFRPSVLDGERTESRPLEHLALMVGRPVVAVAKALVGRRSETLGRLAPIPVRQVARAIVRHAIDRVPNDCVVEGWDLYDP
jgi:uncharacterized protein YbjT (DUF2867 family)